MSATHGDDILIYSQKVEQAFLQMRGKGNILVGDDWKTIEDWHKRGVPCEMIIRIIKEGFEKVKTAGHNRVITSIRYFIPMVNEAERLKTAAYVGKNEHSYPVAVTQMLSGKPTNAKDDYGDWVASKIDPDMVAYGKAYYDRIHGGKKDVAIID